MTTEEYLRTRLVDNDLAEPFLKCLEHQRKLELENQGLQKIVDALKGVPLCAKCHGDGFWLYHNSDGSGADRYDCVCKPLRDLLRPEAKPKCEADECFCTPEGSAVKGPCDFCKAKAT